MTKKILVLVDGSENSNRALDKAIELAQEANYELSLFHVVITEDRFEHFSDLPEPFLTEVKKALEATGQSVLDSAKAKVPSTVKAEAFNEIGNPADQALEFIEKTKPDIVIVGGRGHGTLKRHFLGSVSRYLGENAPCPVMVVK